MCIVGARYGARNLEKTFSMPSIALHFVRANLGLSAQGGFDFAASRRWGFGLTWVIHLIFFA
jgi:hypothetical protein